MSRSIGGRRRTFCVEDGTVVFTGDVDFQRLVEGCFTGCCKGLAEQGAEDEAWRTRGDIVDGDSTEDAED